MAATLKYVLSDKSLSRNLVAKNTFSKEISCKKIHFHLQDDECDILQGLPHKLKIGDWSHKDKNGIISYTIQPKIQLNDLFGGVTSRNVFGGFGGIVFEPNTSCRCSKSPFSPESPLEMTMMIMIRRAMMMLRMKMKMMKMKMMMMNMMMIWLFWFGQIYDCSNQSAHTSHSMHCSFRWL